LDARPGLPFGAVGLFLIAAGLALAPFPWVALGAVAAGNAMFHARGGRDVLCRSPGKMTAPGIFVSAGAVGVSLGMIAPAVSPLWAPAALAAACGVSVLVFCKTPDAADAEPTQNGKPARLPVRALVALALVCVLIRAYVGSWLPAPWTAAFPAAVVLPGLCACAGKAAGGVLADRFGGRTVGVLSLLACVPLFLFGTDALVTGAAGILSFNITMPITLCTAAGRLPRRPGLAFGLTTLALLWGSLLAVLWHPQGSGQKLMLAAFALAAAVTLFVAAERKNPKLKPLPYGGTA
jgi:FSR family fosmidomycin resistance protein-like MFS transporter